MKVVIKRCISFCNSKFLVKLSLCFIELKEKQREHLCGVSRTPRGVDCLYTIVLYLFHYFSAVSFYGVSRRLVLPPIHNFLCISSVGDCQD